jgi:SAM-dependent methyltransferase
MLREHLTQDHDLASRQFVKIDAHVKWIHRFLMRQRPGRVLDLCCGPGLYTSRLAALGHSCYGIDFSPASIEHAKQAGGAAGAACEYCLGDVRTAQYGGGYDLAMLIYGEFNMFRPADARDILERAHCALAPGGRLLLEPQTFASLRQQGDADAGWYSSVSGLFSDRPHLVLTEFSWDADQSVLTTRYFVLDTDGMIARHASSAQAYRRDELSGLLEECAYVNPVVYPSLTGDPDEDQAALYALVAQKPGEQPR